MRIAGTPHPMDTAYLSSNDRIIELEAKLNNAIEFGSGGIKKLRRKARAHLRQDIKDSGASYNIRGGIASRVGRSPDPIVVSGMASDNPKTKTMKAKQLYDTFKGMQQDYHTGGFRNERGIHLPNEVYKQGLQGAAYKEFPSSNFQKTLTRYKGRMNRSTLSKDNRRRGGRRRPVLENIYGDTGRPIKDPRETLGGRIPIITPTILKDRDVAGLNPNIPTRNEKRRANKLLALEQKLDIELSTRAAKMLRQGKLSDEDMEKLKGIWKREREIKRIGQGGVQVADLVLHPKHGQVVRKSPRYGMVNPEEVTRDSKRIQAAQKKLGSSSGFAKVHEIEGRGISYHEHIKGTPLIDLPEIKKRIAKLKGMTIPKEKMKEFMPTTRDYQRLDKDAGFLPPSDLSERSQRVRRRDARVTRNDKIMENLYKIYQREMPLTPEQKKLDAELQKKGYKTSDYARRNIIKTPKGRNVIVDSLAEAQDDGLMTRNIESRFGPFQQRKVADKRKAALKTAIGLKPKAKPKPKPKLGNQPKRPRLGAAPKPRIPAPSAAPRRIPRRGGTALAGLAGAGAIVGGGILAHRAYQKRKNKRNERLTGVPV